MIKDSGLETVQLQTSTICKKKKKEKLHSEKKFLRIHSFNSHRVTVNKEMGNIVIVSLS